MKVIKDVAYATEHPSQVLDIYLPDTNTFDVFVYFHGGGIEAGDKVGEYESVMIAELLKEGIAAVSVNYRMYPFARYPEFLYDAAAAVAWVKEHIGEYGSCKRIFAGGSSAGGYMAMMIYFDRRYLAPFHMSPCDLAGFVFDAGQPTTHFNVLRERGIDSRRVIVDEAAPLYHVKQYDGEPPVLIFVASDDIENRYPQTRLLMSTMAHFAYPKEHITYHFMENYSHCAYDGEPVFGQRIASFIKETK